MTWLVDPATRELLPAMPKSDNWPPKPLSIYADFDYRSDAMTGPDLVDDTAPDVPDSDPRDDDVGEAGPAIADADPTGPDDHPAVPE